MDFVEMMRRFVKEAGKMAVAFREDSRPSLKPDHSVVTRADKAISDLAQEHLAPTLARPGHVLIEEEAGQTEEVFQGVFAEETPYVWSVDPIDGTRNYANQLPHFGISIGLLKDLSPFMGMVYFPVLKELFLCDGQEACFVREAFTPAEKTRKITPVDQEISHQSIFFTMDTFWRDYQWDHKDCHVNKMGAAVIDLCWPAVGRGCGAILRAFLWDFAGPWPILKAAGLDLRALDTGRRLDRLRKDIFVPQRPWRLKDYYLVSSERNFPVLQRKITARTDNGE